MAGDSRLDFSFSGLKTAVRMAATDLQPLSDQDVSDICASFQHTVSRVLQDRIGRGLERFRTEFPQHGASPALVVAGGVAANKALRQTLQALCDKHGFQFIAPPLSLCTDNAAMIAWAALERMAAGLPPDDLNFAPRSRWPLDAESESRIGSGRRGAKA
jgi:N6-L-threonylcarbamoyladenine synthase